MIKLHARVTREIEITEEQARELINKIRSNNGNFEDIRNMFTEGIASGDYEKGYIPAEWIRADLGLVGGFGINDIDL